MHKKNLVLLITLGIIVVTIPLTVFVAQKQQKIRQQAAISEIPPSLYFAIAMKDNKDNPVAINRLSLKPGESVTVSLRLNTNSKDINGFDITLKSQSILAITKTDPGADAILFDTEIFNAINGLDNSLNFSRVSSNTTKSTLGQNLDLLQITLKAQSGGNGTIQILKADFTSPSLESQGFVPGVTVASLPFDILGPTSPPLPTSIPTPTPPVPGSTVIDLSLTLEGIEAKRTLPSKAALMPIILEAFKDSDTTNLVSSKQGLVVYNPVSGKFQGTVDFGILAKGDYLVKIKINKYLKKLSQNVLTVIGGTQTQTIPVAATLLRGSINDDDVIDVLDYNAILSCYGNKLNTPLCKNRQVADLNFDGVVDIIDLNIIFRNFDKTDD